MTQQHINLGTPPAGTDGDTTRMAWQKAEANFNELYAGADGLIVGLKMEWLSGTSVRVSSGSAHIPSLGRSLRVPNAITRSGLMLTANAWYHIYLFQNGSDADIEVSTTAPASPYSGTARTKSGDATRRYVGSIKTDATGNVIKFVQSFLTVMWQTRTGSAPLRVLSNGVATASTVVSVAGAIPVTSIEFLARVTNLSSAASNNFFVANPNAFNPVNSVDFVAAFGPLNDTHATLSTDSLQQINYAYGFAPPAGGAFIDVVGYKYER